MTRKETLIFFFLSVRFCFVFGVFVFCFYFVFVFCLFVCFCHDFSLGKRPRKTSTEGVNLSPEAQRFRSKILALNSCKAHTRWDRLVSWSVT